VVPSKLTFRHNGEVEEFDSDGGVSENNPRTSALVSKESTLSIRLNRRTPEKKHALQLSGSGQKYLERISAIYGGGGGPEQDS
jgi:hypothetical protein